MAAGKGRQLTLAKSHNLFGCLVAPLFLAPFTASFLLMTLLALVRMPLARKTRAEICINVMISFAWRS